MLRLYDVNNVSDNIVYMIYISHKRMENYVSFLIMWNGNCVGSKI